MDMCHFPAEFNYVKMATSFVTGVGGKSFQCVKVCISSLTHYICTSICHYLTWLRSSVFPLAGQ